jgi:hypothetical protein
MITQLQGRHIAVPGFASGDYNLLFSGFQPPQAPSTDPGRRGLARNAHPNERAFASTHIYQVASGTPVVTILRGRPPPEGHGGEDRHQTRDELHEETLAEDPDFSGARASFSTFWLMHGGRAAIPRTHSLSSCELDERSTDAVPHARRRLAGQRD